MRATREAREVSLSASKQDSSCCRGPSAADLTEVLLAGTRGASSLLKLLSLKLFLLSTSDEGVVVLEEVILLLVMPLVL